MKKLLALILCVMLFVSVIPTMAFAADPDPAAIKAAEANVEAATKAAADALAASTKTFNAKNDAAAEVSNLNSLLGSAKTAYDSALATYASAPTAANKLALDEATAKRDSLQEDYDDAVAAQKLADAAYAEDLKAEKIANAELVVAQAELTYAQTPNATNKAAIAVAEADLAAVIAANTEIVVVPVLTEKELKEYAKAVMDAKKADVDALNVAYKEAKDELLSDTQSAILVAENAAVAVITDAYADKVDEIIANSAIAYQEQLDTIADNIVAEIAKIGQ
jgi:hypothetical protein